MEWHSGMADGDTPLSARLRVTAHWLLWAAGKSLAVLLLALAGGYGMWGGMWGAGGVLVARVLEGMLSLGEKMLNPGGDSWSR